MTIQDAIAHCEEVSSKCGNKGCAADHLQLKGWLEQVQDLFRLKELACEANAGWKPDWGTKADKYVIVQICQHLHVKMTMHEHSILAFKDIETAYKFLKENDGLIRKVFGFFY
jgi:hypothetical protein